jgi:hypothetical protein
MHGSRLRVWNQKSSIGIDASRTSCEPRCCSCPSQPIFSPPCLRLCRNGDLNLNTGLDVDDDLLDDLGRRVEVDEALVDAHLEGVPGLGTLTVRRLAGSDLEVLGRETDGTCTVNTAPGSCEGED